MLYANFVSRQRELAQLDAFYTQASSGQGQVCFVTGDAGSGKSTLVREFCRYIQDKDKDVIVAFGQSLVRLCQ